MNRLDLDWLDVSGLISLSAIFAGAWMLYGMGVALLVAGGLLGAVVVALTFRRVPEPRR